MPINFENIKIVAFDADDTLWENENFFRDAEKEFYQLLREYGNPQFLEQKLFRTEVGHLSLYGYAIKSFILSMIETALSVSKNQVSSEITNQILLIGKRMLAHPVLLLPEVENCLKHFQLQDYQIILATKGDILDQERKLKQSGLSSYFHHIEVMTEKKTENYQSLFDRLNAKAEEFLMIGNSLKSDVIPVIELGGQAIHVPYRTTWSHESVKDSELIGLDYLQIKSLGELIS